MYTPYLTYEEYTEMGGNTLPQNEASNFLKRASREIDSLTFNRILQFGGIDKLTDFQKEIIKECTAAIADFDYDNFDMLNSAYKSYSINGVSMTFGDGLAVANISGIFVPTSTYRFLSQTGLTNLLTPA